ncbi:hypothetical protein U0070_019125 [Myodes glareolus]|uniref:G-protein-signaling modulator 2 n=1 Tax=Myodes glareolus TaxID=447135 RepID=A0AAW0HCX1_MYOGA
MEGNLLSMREDHSFHVRYRMEASCLELALEGERLCKSGDCRAGVSFFEAAVQVGTEDLKTLSAIYSQLGNAYFYLHDYAKALEYHHHDLTLARENLSLVTALGDRAAQGRAFGNLGNTHYLLGNFRDAVIAHEQRLLIAKEFGDKAAERRAYSNLGNAYIFLGEFETASEYYRKTLLLARQLKDRAVEAQSCYSLGNTYTLLQDYEKAIEYHLKHLAIAQELKDRIGEGRACWSLGNAYTALGNHDQAMHFAEKHLDISREVGDKSGELTARLNLSDLQMVLGARSKLGRRHSMENMELMKLTPEKVPNWSSELLAKQKSLLAKPSAKLLFVSRLKGKKFKGSTSTKVLQDASNSIDHRAPHPQKVSPGGPPSVPVVSPNTDEFLDLLASSQSRRLDDQRASFSNLPGLRLTKNNNQSVLERLVTNDKNEPDEDFFDILVKCQGSRLDDQRCAPPPAATKGPTVPDEDFFSLILRSQAKRMDEQRVLLQRDPNRDTEFGLKELLQNNALLEFKHSGK